MKDIRPVGGGDRTIEPHVDPYWERCIRKLAIYRAKKNCLINSYLIDITIFPSDALASTLRDHGTARTFTQMNIRSISALSM